MMGNESLGDIRALSPEEHWAHFARAWVALRLAVGVVVVISPQPVTPSSVVNSTNRNSPQ